MDQARVDSSDEEVDGWVVWEGFHDPNDNDYPYFQVDDGEWVPLWRLKYEQELRAYANLAGVEVMEGDEHVGKFSVDLTIPKYWLEKKDGIE